MNNKTWLILVAAVLAIAVLIWYWRRSPDCAFSGWKNSVGVELEATISNLHTVKTKVGLNDEQIRDFDTLLKDYAIKYDGACQDFNNKRMNQSEYTCRRRNMDNTLDQIRRFIQAVEAAKSIQDPSTQRTVILDALKDLRAGSQSGYGAGCVSTMVVDPKKLTYSGHTARNSLQISNAGNNDLIFTVENLPEAFIAEPKGGQLARGVTTSVMIYRLAFPVVPSEPITIHMRSNFQEDVPIQLEVDKENAALYEAWSNQLQSVAEAEHRKPQIKDAVQIIDKSFGSTSTTGAENDGIRYLLAASMLTNAGDNSQALEAIRTATAKNPSLSMEPSTYLLRGILIDRQGRTFDALNEFAEAKRLASPADTYTMDTSDLFSCVARYKSDRETARDCVSQPEVRAKVQRNPQWASYLAREFHDPTLNEAFEPSSAHPPRM